MSKINSSDTPSCSKIHTKIPFEEWDELESEKYCQFKVQPEDLIIVDEEYWCIYHAPSLDKKLKPTLKKTLGEGFSELFHKQILDEKKDHYGDFRGVIFPCEMNFSNILFTQPCDFSFCTFEEDALFIGTQFISDLTMYKVVCKDDISFYNSRFDDGISMTHCNFLHSADFQASTKGKHDDYEIRQQIKSIDISHSTFSKVNFSNRHFKGKTDFRNCIFKVAPKFHESKLHEETFFPPFKKFLDTDSPEAYQAYRVLKLSMENVRNRLDEGAFFALEQRSLRKSRPFRERYFSFSTLYDAISTYGLNSIRPMAWLFLFTFFFSQVYYKISGKILWVDSFIFSLKQSIKPFSTWNINEKPGLKLMFEEHQLSIIKILSSAHSILALSVITLFLLSLRWRFKRG